MEENRSATVGAGGRPKRQVLVAAAVFAVLAGPVWILFDERGWQARVIDVVSILCVGLLVFSWCYYDSLERGTRPGAGFRLLVVLLGLPTLFIYLLKSRGLRRGLPAVGAALLVCAALILLMFISASVAAVALGVE